MPCVPAIVTGAQHWPNQPGSGIWRTGQTGHRKNLDTGTGGGDLNGPTQGANYNGIQQLALTL
jgi:hypothetical protein